MILFFNSEIYMVYTRHPREWYCKI